LRSPEDSDALHDREMVQHVERGDLGIDAELLRQIAEDAAHLVLLAEHVDAVERDRAGVGILQRGDVRISELLPAPFGPSRPNILLPMVSERFLSALTPFG
jgi:hypothetical protein